MPDTVQDGELGMDNGLTFTIGSTQICKIIDKGTIVSLIARINFKKSDFALPTKSADGLITFKVGKTEDLTDTDNLLSKGVPDVYFSVKKQTVFLNLELPINAVKHTTGKKKKKSAPKKKKS